ncbi:uncharacterized protein LOC131063721 [Cryptomeria japonica]|uniref:uncharacterized protein LOC131063721 n=1 Tax=Cryptomeria japonica TaxID=3369 RepID=UPI0027DA9E01|nr:uncharacterized protein LOC131063721 [Cryptomeria japonica]
MEMEKTDECLRRKKSDDASAAIAAKLLQGWALLNDYCPQCINPLLRNREGRMYCVGCSQFVIRESDAPAPVLENPVDRSQIPREAATLNDSAIQNGYMGNAHGKMTASTPVQQVEPSNVSTFISNGLPKADNNGSMRRNDGYQPNEESGKMKSLFSKVDLPSNISAVLSQTLCTLVQKIEETSKLIAVTHDPLVIKQLLEIIEHCIQVMQQITTFSSR